MPAKKATKEKLQRETSRARAEEKPAGSGRKYWAVLFIVVILFAIAGGLVYDLSGPSSTASFSTFSNNFYSAPAVAIVVSGSNGTELSSAIGCGTLIIEQITENQATPRNASSIDFYSMNSTSCTYSMGLGYPLKNASYASPAQCISMASAVPRIFVNYSSSNSTIITTDALYVSGDTDFLAMCGIASELR